MPSAASLAPAPRPAHGHAGTHPSGPAGRRPAERGGPPHHGRRRPSVRELAATFARLYLEVECGRRSAAQAGPLLDRRLAAQLESVWVRPGAPGRLLAVTGERVTSDVYEAVAVVRRGRRVGAIAIRLVHRQGRWTVVEASRPEDGPLPEPAYPLPDDELDGFDLLALEGTTTPPAGAAPPSPVGGNRLARLA